MLYGQSRQPKAESWLDWYSDLKHRKPKERMTAKSP
jgi:hypothetical protein